MNATLGGRDPAMLPSRGPVIEEVVVRRREVGPDDEAGPGR